jgi:hypothetical protein
VALGQEHVPEPQRLGLLLEVLKNGRVGVPSRVTDADLGLEDGIGAGKMSDQRTCMRVSTWRETEEAGLCSGLRDAVFLDKLGNDVQRLLCPLAHAVTDLQGAMS